MATTAKILTVLGAAVLLASGTCFLVFSDVLGNGAGGTPTLPWVVGVVLVVGGVLALVAGLGLGRSRGR